MQVCGRIKPTALPETIIDADVDYYGSASRHSQSAFRYWHSWTSADKLIAVQLLQSGFLLPVVVKCCKLYKAQQQPQQILHLPL
jgi:hypothetical protein